jgi:predicted dehydrogenase
VVAIDQTVYATRPAAGGGVGRVGHPDARSVIAELKDAARATMILSRVARHADDTSAFETFGTDGTIRYWRRATRFWWGRPVGWDSTPWS